MTDIKEKKDYGKLIKFLQIITGILLIIMVAAGIFLIQKYNIKMSNIQNLSEFLSGGILTVSLLIIGISVIKSFCLVFPPAVIFSVCAYVLPNYFYALAVNIISVILSLAIPYFLGRFTGAGMIDTLSKKFKAVKKIDDFIGINETKMTAVIKFSGILPGDLSSLLFGAMNISFKSFMTGSVIGNIPLIIVYTLFGTVLKNVGDKPWVVAIPVVIIILFLLIAGALAKRMITQNKNV